MIKREIQTLIQGYDGQNADPSTISYQKGIRKRFLNTRTRGMQELHEWISSPEIVKLKDSAEITGDPLKCLLRILKKRDERISGSKRSYENKPDKSTNQVYANLYKILWLDVLKNSLDQQLLDPEESSSYVAPDYQRKLTTLFLRVNNQELAHQEMLARSKEKRFFLDDQDVTAAHRLGISLLTSKPIEYSFNEIALALKNPMQEVDNLKKSSRLGSEVHDVFFMLSEQKIRVIFVFIYGALTSLSLIPYQLKVGYDPHEGLEWMKYSSNQGEASSSYYLAEHYDRVSNCSNCEKNQKQSIEYLELAKQQGSSRAENVLKNGWDFEEPGTVAKPFFFS